MANQNSRAQIEKASWLLVESIKDSLNTTVSLAVRAKQIDVAPDVLQKLLLVIGGAIDEGTRKGSRSFSRMVDEALSTATVETKPKKKLA